MELTTFYLTNKTRNGYYQSRKFVTINKDSQTLTFGNIDQSSGVELKTCIVLDQKDWWTIKENRKEVDTEPSGKCTFEYKELMKLVPAIDFYLYSVPYSAACNDYSDDRW